MVSYSAVSLAFVQVRCITVGLECHVAGMVLYGGIGVHGGVVEKLYNGFCGSFGAIYLFVCLFVS